MRVELFYLIAILCLFFSLGAVFSTKVVTSLFCFLGCVLTVTLLFVLLQASAIAVIYMLLFCLLVSIYWVTAIVFLPKPNKNAYSKHFLHVGVFLLLGGWLLFVLLPFLQVPAFSPAEIDHGFGSARHLVNVLFGPLRHLWYALLALILAFLISVPVLIRDNTKCGDLS